MLSVLAPFGGQVLRVSDFFHPFTARFAYNGCVGFVRREDSRSGFFPQAATFLASAPNFLGRNEGHFHRDPESKMRVAEAQQTGDLMGKKIYVGNLSYDVTDATLQTMFAPHGNVQSAQVIIDRETGRSKGFGFVEMGTDDEAKAAIAALNGQDNGGRALTVNEAKPREDRPSGGRGGFGGGGGGGGGRGGRY
jgi:RNA recognition motif-containing protein